MERNSDSSTLPMPADVELVSARVFDAPRELVFAAWTNPKQVERWWGPKGYVSYNCEIDLRVGGRFSLLMRGPDGTIYPCEGTFREILPPERLVYIGADSDGSACGAGLPPGATVTVTFAECEGRTTLTIHTLLPSAEAREAAIAAGYTVGWPMTLERLADALN